MVMVKEALGDTYVETLESSWGLMWTFVGFGIVIHCHAFSDGANSPTGNNKIPKY